MENIIVNVWNDIDVYIAEYEMKRFCKENGELSQLFRFFKIKKLINIPFRITKSERPDFIVSSIEGERKIGIEVTYAANKTWEEADSYLLNKKNPKYDTISRNWFEGIDLKGRDLGKYLESVQSDDIIWGSGEQARAKAKEVVNAIERKTHDIGLPDYQRFEDNYLIISDRSPFLFLDIIEFEKHIKEFLQNYQIEHDNIFFLTHLRNRKTDQNIDRLFMISRKNCNIIS